MAYKPILNEDIKVRVPAGAALPLTDEPTTADAAYKVYQITDPEKRVLDPKEPIIVQVNGSPVSSGYKLDRLAGKVIFDAARDPGDTVTVSGKYIPMVDAAQAYQFSLGSQVLSVEDTVFGKKWVSRKVIMRDHTASLAQWHVVNQDMMDEFQSDNIKVLEIRLGAGKYLMWAVHMTDEISGQQTNLQSETLQLQGTQDADGRVISRG